MNLTRSFPFIFVGFAASLALAGDADVKVQEDGDKIVITTPQLEATFKKKGYVSGVSSLVDRKTGLRDLGFGLDIVDWIMEPGSDEADRDRLPKEMIYTFNNAYHGKTPKRSIEGPQICTQAKQLDLTVLKGDDFTAVTTKHNYTTAAPGKKTGSLWEQAVVFPKGKRWFVSRDRITTVNDSDSLFLRIDLPGHVKHKNGDTFSEVYLSYYGQIPSKDFTDNFAPDEKFLYTRGKTKLPERMIRAYRIRDPKTGQPDPWLAGMTLEPKVVTEAWCHQRGYICMIEEFGGQPIKAGQSFSAAFIVGFFDSIEEMNQVYDAHKGKNELYVDAKGWRLATEPVGVRK